MGRLGAHACDMIRQCVDFGMLTMLLAIPWRLRGLCRFVNARFGVRFVSYNRGE